MILTTIMISLIIIASMVGAFICIKNEVFGVNTTFKKIILMIPPVSLILLCCLFWIGIICMIGTSIKESIEEYIQG